MAFFVCYTVASADWVNAWLQLANLVGGYRGTTFDLESGPGKIDWFRSPLTKDPGVPDDKKQQKKKNK